MQNYHDLQNTEAANVYLDKVKDNIQTVASNFSGTSFPTDNLQVGMLCYRTDKKKLYQLTDTDPITWESVQSSLTFDTTPTAGSKNPVTSGGVKTALDGKLSLTGNASSATKAESDWNGNRITDTYAKKTDVPAVTVSGNTISFGSVTIGVD